MQPLRALAASLSRLFGLPVVNCRPNRSVRQSLPRERDCRRIALAHISGHTRTAAGLRMQSDGLAHHRTAQRSPEGQTATVCSDGSAARRGREYSSITARAARSSCAASRYAKLRPSPAQCAPAVTAGWRRRGQTVARPSSTAHVSTHVVLIRSQALTMHASGMRSGARAGRCTGRWL